MPIGAQKTPPQPRPNLVLPIVTPWLPDPVASRITPSELSPQEGTGEVLRVVVVPEQPARMAATRTKVLE